MKDAGERSGLSAPKRGRGRARWARYADALRHRDGMRELRSGLRSSEGARRPGEPPFLGRSWRELLERIQDAIGDPSVQTVLIEGEPGVGKSRLAAALAEELAGRAVEYYFGVNAAQPYWNSADAFFRFCCAELSRLWRIADFSGEDDDGRMRKRFQDALCSAGEKAGRTRRQIVLVDGIEESCACQDILSALLPCEGVVFVVFAQPDVAPSTDLREGRKFDLSGCRLEDGEALQVLKHRLGKAVFESVETDLRIAVRAKASRLPLMLAMLAEDILGDPTRSVPKDWRRIVRDGYIGPRSKDWDDVEKLALGVLAFSQRGLRDGELAAILGIQRGDVDRALRRPKRCLQRWDRAAGWRFSNKLFQEACRELYGEGLGRILKWLAGWRTADTDAPEYGYAMEYLPLHLKEAGKVQELADLLTELDPARSFVAAKVRWLRPKDAAKKRKPLLPLVRDFQTAMALTASKLAHSGFIRLFAAREAVLATIGASTRSELEDMVRRGDVADAVEAAGFCAEPDRATLFVACAAALGRRGLAVQTVRRAMRLRSVWYANEPLLVLPLVWLAKEYPWADEVRGDRASRYRQESGHRPEVYVMARIWGQTAIMGLERLLWHILAALRWVWGQDWLDELHAKVVRDMSEDDCCTFSPSDISMYFFPFVSPAIRDRLGAELLKEPAIPAELVEILRRSEFGRSFLGRRAEAASVVSDTSALQAFAQRVREGILILQALGETDRASALAGSALKRLTELHAEAAGRGDKNPLHELFMDPGRWLAWDIVALVRRDRLERQELEAYRVLERMVALLEQDGIRPDEAKAAALAGAVEAEDFLFRTAAPTTQEIQDMVRKCCVAISWKHDVESLDWQAQAVDICVRAKILSEPGPGGDTFHARLGLKFSPDSPGWISYVDELLERPAKLKSVCPDLERICRSHMPCADSRGLATAVVSAAALQRVGKPGPLVEVAESVLAAGLERLACENQDPVVMAACDRALAFLLKALADAGFSQHALLDKVLEFDRDRTGLEVSAIVAFAVRKQGEDRVRIETFFRRKRGTDVLMALEVLGDKSLLDLGGSMLRPQLQEAILRRPEPVWEELGDWSRWERLAAEKLLELELAQGKPAWEARQIAPLLQALLSQEADPARFRLKATQCFSLIKDGEGKAEVRTWLDWFWRKRRKGESVRMFGWLVDYLMPLGPEWLLKAYLRILSEPAGVFSPEFANGLVGTRTLWCLMTAAAVPWACEHAAARWGIFRRVLYVLACEGGEGARQAAETLLLVRKASTRAAWALAADPDNDAKFRSHREALAAEQEEERLASPDVSHALKEQFDTMKEQLAREQQELLKAMERRFDPEAFADSCLESLRLKADAIKPQLGTALKLRELEVRRPHWRRLQGATREAVALVECLVSMLGQSPVEHLALFEMGRAFELEVNRVIRPFADRMREWARRPGNQAEWRAACADLRQRGMAEDRLAAYVDGKSYTLSLGQMCVFLRCLAEEQSGGDWLKEANPRIMRIWKGHLACVLDDVFRGGGVYNGIAFRKFCESLWHVVLKRNEAVHPGGLKRVPCLTDVPHAVVRSVRDRLLNGLDQWAGWLRG